MSPDLSSLRSLRSSLLVLTAVLLISSRASAEAPPFGSSLTLDALVREVLARSPTSSAAEAALTAARARAEGAGAFMDPMVSYSFAPLSIGSEHGEFGQSVMLSQKLPFFGKRGAEKKAAAAEAEKRAAERLTAHEQLALEATREFAVLYARHRELEIHERHRALVEELKVSAEARYRTGLAPQFATLEAQMALAELDADVLEHEGMRAMSVARINALLHRAPHEPLPPPQVELSVPELAAEHVSHAVGPHAPVGVPQRPELAALLAEETRAEAEQERARRESFPDLEVRGEYSTMWASPDHRLMVGVAVAIPLQLGVRASMREAADAELQRTRRERERMEDEFRAELASANAQLAAARGRASVLRDRMIPLAKARVESTRAAYVTGRAELADALNAERAQRDAEISFHASLAEVVLREAELRRAEGRLAPTVETSR